MLAAVLVVAGCTTEPGEASSAEDGARQAAAAFLARYVDQDGRVVRRDQGGDSVSEGVSYALLLAQVAEDTGTERDVWAWAQQMRRRDGLMSFRVGPDGRVLDEQAASDADLVTAWALRRSEQAELNADAGPLARAVR